MGGKPLHNSTLGDQVRQKEAAGAAPTFNQKAKNVRNILGTVQNTLALRRHGLDKGGSRISVILYWSNKFKFCIHKNPLNSFDHFKAFGDSRRVLGESDLGNNISIKRTKDWACPTLGNTAKWIQ